MPTASVSAPLAAVFLAAVHGVQPGAGQPAQGAYFEERLGDLLQAAHPGGIH
jgi:hypothetical protein